MIITIMITTAKKMRTMRKAKESQRVRIKKKMSMILNNKIMMKSMLTKLRKILKLSKNKESKFYHYNKLTVKNRKKHQKQWINRRKILKEERRKLRRKKIVQNLRRKLIKRLRK